MSHLTATVRINQPSRSELQSIYFGRATAFQKIIKILSFGTDATKFSGRIIDGSMQLYYDGKSIPEPYEIRI